VVAAAAIKTAAATVEAKMRATAAVALVMIALAALTIAFFVAHHVIANTIACVVPIAIAFVSVQQKGRW
jgi:hypothetical protein